MSNIVENVCNIVLFLIAADLFSSYENVHYVGLTIYQHLMSSEDCLDKCSKDFFLLKEEKPSITKPTPSIN